MISFANLSKRYVISQDDSDFLPEKSFVLVHSDLDG